MNGSPEGEPGGTPQRNGPPEEGFSVSEFAGVGIQFAVSILFFLYVGQWLDRKFGTAPWLLIIGVFVGAAASFYSMYRKLMAAQARDEAARKARKEKRP